MDSTAVKRLRYVDFTGEAPEAACAQITKFIREPWDLHSVEIHTDLSTGRPFVRLVLASASLPDEGEAFRDPRSAEIFGPL